MSSSFKILSLLLTIMLACSNMAYGSHISKHDFTDTTLCDGCMHQCGSDDAVLPLSLYFQAELASDEPEHDQATVHFNSAALFDHQSRAPPPTA